MADEETPQDPMTELAVAATQQHEMYLGWMSAGFTDAQSMELLKAFITAMVMKSS
jgi:hypothetical protein